MLLQLLAIFACVLAVVMQLAAYHSPDILDTEAQRNGRRIMLVAMLVAVFALTEATISGRVFPALNLVAVLMGVGQALFASSELKTAHRKEASYHEHVT
jgi:hypothetical protein